MKYVAYYRVSTKRQGISGLGSEAQKSIIGAFIKGDDIIEEFTDIENGTSKGNNRSELKKALKSCSDNEAILVIAKLDRLARNVNFTSAIMESGVNFIACDMPQANKFTIHIFAALAEQEAYLISQRTTEALQSLIKQGKKLGSPENLTYVARLKGVQAIKLKSKTNENNRRASSMIKLLKERGLNFNRIAKELNDQGFKTSKGKEFQAIQVKRLYNNF
jgi:DNA invertase Pin-like site-specific DNA recombinase